MLPVRAARTMTGVKAIDVKEISILMILMVFIYLLLLFWEKEPDENIVMTSIEHLNVDYPKSNIPVRYCNAMILQKIIREPNHMCKKEHVFIHERPQKLNSICLSPRKMTCLNNSNIFCFQSETKFKLTVCHLVEGTAYPGCRYQASTVEGHVLVTCDTLGPINFQGYVK
ncbi:probable inactive ribonuclease-like protein 12 [Octodon degus]|uniref:Probable inactive ribonuclease-like protein 12 n=1 Tax=Octodon degus TaxID=10160 RepID=A0A6P3FSX0_OCTDE|nr:probable inactive ribonuclease-like protein 12 [Octodon degus]